MPQVSRPTTQPQQNAAPQGGQSFGVCVKCGLPGHMAKNCPNRQQTQGVNQQQRSQGQQNFTYGKVNHVNAEEAQQSQDVVLGMFHANSHPAMVLFDSGASHSFITSKFVAKHNLPITIIKYTMIVSSPGGEMKTKHICPAISIAIRGVDLLSNLIIIDSQGIDIILGMDWLRKYDGVIMCAKRAIRLTQEDGTTVEFTVEISANQTSVLNQVKGTSLDKIRVVQEFPDVFLEELPGMPPHRDIEFLIELLPGTPLISRRPYRMPMNELVELK
jgi:hypothetical protein